MPPAVLRGKALYDLLTKQTIVIYDDEPIVGNQGPERHSAQIFPEFSTDWLEDELNTLEQRKSDPFVISREDKDEIFALLEEWKERNTKHKAVEGILPEAMTASNERVYTLTALSSGLGHISVNYQSILELGTSGILAQIISAESNCRDPEKKAFYQGTKWAMQALAAFAARYADLAERNAAAEPRETRRAELQKISQICRRVPRYPATTFREALQSFWFLHLALQIESNGHSISPGRFDQYMYPYYRRDVDEGRLTRDEALELLEWLYIKFNEVNKIRDRVGTLAFGGYPMFQNLIVGGVDASGKDATNDLSILCLEAGCALQMPQPSLSVRWHDKMDRRLMEKCCELTQTGIGMPAFFNDEAIIPLLQKTGASLEEARDYAEVGCVEPQVPGKSEGLYSGGFMNLCKILEITLNNGVNPNTGTEYTLKTGLHFETFEQFYEAYRKQLEHFVALQANADNLIDAAHAQLCPTPLVSCFVDDCIASGRDVRSGGAVYNFTSPNIVGLANAADSLAVIKKKVYEERRLTLEELRAVLAEDYRSDELLRHEFLNSVPKYGNDNPYVDELARRIASDYCDIVHTHTNFRGGKFEPGMQSISAHAMFVGNMGATPDGRRSTDLVSDGGVSPAQGRDSKGATAVIRSVARLDQTKATNGALLNIKFHPSAVRGQKGVEVLSALVDSYFRMGGQHIQFNVVSTKTLRDAQRHPEDYRGLVVRVAGFSVLFTTLDKVLQDDIIERTENSM